MEKLHPIPLKKVIHLLYKLRSCQALLFENLVRGSTTQQKGRGAHYGAPGCSNIGSWIKYSPTITRTHEETKAK